MAHAHLDDQPFPRGALIGAGLLVGLSLLAVTASRIGWLPGPAEAQVQSVATASTVRDLRFHDRPDGSVLIVSVGGRSAVIEPNSGGFVRGVVRGLVRDRRARGIGQGPVFRLTQWSDGRLTLEDTGTGRRLAVDVFGPDNERAFVDLLRQTGAAT